MLSCHEGGGHGPRTAFPGAGGFKGSPLVALVARELSGRGIEALLAFLLGGLVSWGLGRWRRRRQRQSILRGDARDTVVIEHHIVEAAEAPDPGRPGLTRRVPSALRIRVLGQSELSRVVPNGHLAAEFSDRA